jgi:hypothetical protein
MKTSRSRICFFCRPLFGPSCTCASLAALCKWRWLGSSPSQKFQPIFFTCLLKIRQQRKNVTTLKLKLANISLYCPNRIPDKVVMNDVQKSEHRLTAQDPVARIAQSALSSGRHIELIIRSFVTFSVIKWCDWIAERGLSSLKINVRGLELNVEPRDDKRDAAWDLWTELLTRNTTLNLASTTAKRRFPSTASVQFSFLHTTHGGPGNIGRIRDLRGQACNVQPHK